MNFEFEHPYLLPIAVVGVLFFLVSRVPRRAAETQVPSIRIWKLVAEKSKTPYFGLNAKITAESFVRAGIVITLVLALSGPEITERRTGFNPVHIGICNSVSLLTESNGKTRLQNARQAALKILSSIDPETPATIYFFAQKLVSFSGTAAEASKFVERFGTLTPGASVDILRKFIPAENSFLIADKPTPGNLCFVGGPTENCGIVAASTEGTDLHMLIFSATKKKVRVMTFGSVPNRQEQIDLNAGLNSVKLSGFERTPARISLQTEDGFAIDDTFILESGVATYRVCGEIDKFTMAAIAASGFEAVTGKAEIEVADFRNASSVSSKKVIFTNVDNGRLEAIHGGAVSLNRIFKEGDSAIFTFENLSDCTGTSQPMGEPVLSVGELAVCSVKETNDSVTFYLYFSAPDKSIVRTRAFPVLWLRMLDYIRNSQSVQIPPIIEADSFEAGKYNLASFDESSNSHSASHKFELPAAVRYTSRVVSLQPIFLWASAVGGLIFFIFSAGR